MLALENIEKVSFCRIGRYHDAAVSNVKAFNADLKLAQHCMTPYEPEHNTDMLIYTAAMAGEVSLASWMLAHKVHALGVSC